MSTRIEARRKKAEDAQRKREEARLKAERESTLRDQAGDERRRNRQVSLRAAAFRFTN
jgi:hypothetical protein